MAQLIQRVTRLEGAGGLLGAKMEETKARISVLEVRLQGQGEEGKGRSLLENKIVTSQAKFEGKRKTFREWNDKMNNALGNNRTSFRDVFKWIEDRMPTSETIPGYPEYKGWMESQGKDPISDKSWKELDEGMWGILMDKFEGEARGILLSVPDGKGMSTWAKLWKW